jgi:hypothetical protein
MALIQGREDDMKPSDESECGVCRTPVFERNAYFYGKQLTVRDLLLEQRYLNEKRWLVNRMIAGHGVVCGLDVAWDSEKCEFTVDIGLALDCCGREILICEPQRVPFEEYPKLCEDGYASAGPGRADAPRAESQAGQEPRNVDAGQQQQGYEGERPRERFVLCLEYLECKTDEVYLPPLGCDDHERKEFNHVRESFKLRIKRWDDVRLPGENGQVECLDWPKFDPATCRTELLHQALCRREKRGCPTCECRDCIVLATILVLPPEYGKRYREVRVDSCTYRTLVYRNRLLYELIYCHHGDLPHIVSLSWSGAAHPDRMVEWETFVRLIDEGLAVSFDQEMDSVTLNPHTFIVSFLDRQEGTHGEVVRRRIPGTIQSGRKDQCYEARFVADDKWVKYRLKSGDSPLSYGEDVEIIIRGSNVRSKSGKALDGEFIALPTGNGTPGGEFIDYFRVLKHGESKSAARRYEDF